MSFQDWLTSELKARDWTQSELSRRSGVTRGAISNVLKNREPGPDLCRGIANAFHLPPEDVFRIAGLLPPKPGDDLKVKELNQLVQKMDENNKDELIRIARLKLEIQEERGEYHVGKSPKE